MNETTKRNQALIRELIVRCLIDHPEDLSVLPRESSNGNVYWTVQGHADDYRKICGARGAHVKALTFLTDELGTAAATDYHFWLKESEEGLVRPMKIVNPRDDYDPREAAELLTRLIRACVPEALEAPRVTTYADGSRLETPPFAMIFRFEIEAPHRDFVEWLTKPAEDSEGQSLLGSIQALWRAYGTKNGVAFTVTVKEPTS